MGQDASPLPLVNADGTQEDPLTLEECLKKLPLFEDCDQKFLERVTNQITVEIFDPGQVIVHEGDQSSDLWIVNDGLVEVYSKGKFARGLEGCGAFGELQLLGVRRTSPETAVARTYVAASVLSRRCLTQALSHFSLERMKFQLMSVQHQLQIWSRKATHSARHPCRQLLNLEEERKRLEQGLKMKSRTVPLPKQKPKSEADGYFWDDVDEESVAEEVSKMDFPWNSTITMCSQLEVTSGSHQTLGQWHRQLAASPEGRRLNLWQLDFYQRSTTASPFPEQDKTTSTSKIFSVSERPTPSISRPNTSMEICSRSPLLTPFPPLPPSEREHPTPGSLRSGRRLRPEWGSSSRNASPFSNVVTDSKNSNSSQLQTTSDFLVFGPPRKLEVILRGVFRSEDMPEEDDDDYSYYQQQDLKAAISTSSPSEALANNGDDSELREIMGFGRDEVGEIASGRSSVPAMRDSCQSVPPLRNFGSAVDEGIFLNELPEAVQRHVRRALSRNERGVGGRSNISSPVPDEEQDSSLNLSVVVRLCRIRCGSSSAVLELTLDHSPQCEESGQCCCAPTPKDAEAWLLAYFARHNQLRLSTHWPPVRVLLEPLPQ